MNRTTALLLLADCLIMFVGQIYAPLNVGAQGTPTETQKVGEAIKPPEVKRGDAVRLSRRMYNPKEYVDKTTVAANLWFELGEQYFWFVDWDADRKPFTALVIHHSATSQDATADEIDKIQEERLYVPRYKSASTMPFVKNLPVHSGHVINDKERFISYHHLVYHDGKVTTELSPLRKVKDQWYIDHVGWHAGANKDPKGENGWSLNCRSIAICLIGDFSDKDPSDAQLKAIAGLVAHYRGFNPKLTVIGHRDHAKTVCPGNGWEVWREKIVGE